MTDTTPPLNARLPGHDLRPDAHRTDTEGQAASHAAADSSAIDDPALAGSSGTGFATTPTQWSRRLRALGWTLLSSGVVAGALTLLAGPGYRRHWWSLDIGLNLVRGGAALAVLVFLAGLALLWRSRWQAVGATNLANRRTARWLALGAMVVAASSFLPPASLLWKDRSLPPLHDISTDVVNPPDFRVLLAARAADDPPSSSDRPAWQRDLYDTARAREQLDAYPDIESIWISAPALVAFARTEMAMKSLGLELVDVNDQTLRIEATATSEWFGLKDDIVARITETKTGSVVDLRSSSRHGEGDHGANAIRIRALRDRIVQPARALEAAR